MFVCLFVVVCSEMHSPMMSASWHSGIPLQAEERGESSIVFVCVVLFVCLLGPAFFLLFLISKSSARKTGSKGALCAC